jgi:hypothetical protein
MLKLKSLKEPTNPEDGLRILIARYNFLHSETGDVYHIILTFIVRTSFRVIPMVVNIVFHHILLNYKRSGSILDRNSVVCPLGQLQSGTPVTGLGCVSCKQVIIITITKSSKSIFVV